MPTYEYACSSCNAEWEEDQSIKADPTKECPRCHEQTARRQISRGGGFILKGGGWYSDLYSSSSNKAPPKGESGEGKAAPTPEGSSEKKGETAGAPAKPSTESSSS